MVTTSHLHWEGIFPGALWPRGGHTQPAERPYILLHPTFGPSFLLAPYRLQRPLPLETLTHVNESTSTRNRVWRAHSSLSAAAGHLFPPWSFPSTCSFVYLLWPSRPCNRIARSPWGSCEPRRRFHMNFKDKEGDLPDAEPVSALLFSQTLWETCQVFTTAAQTKCCTWAQIQQRDAISTTNTQTQTGVIAETKWLLYSDSTDAGIEKTPCKKKRG